MFTTTVLYVTPLASTHTFAVITCARFGIAVLFVLIASLLGRSRLRNPTLDYVKIFKQSLCEG